MSRIETATDVPREIEPVHWQHRIPGELPVSVTARLLSNDNLFDEPLGESVLIIPGYGEGKWAATRALQSCGRLGVRATAALVDTKQVPATTKDLAGFATQFAPMVACELEEREQGSSDTEIRRTAIGHSMGGGILGLGLAEAPEFFGDVSFLEPIGHDTAERRRMIPDDDERQRQFTQRFGRVVGGIYRDVAFNDRLHAGAGLFRELITDIFPTSDHRFHNKLSLPVTLDCGPAVLKHAVDNKTVYVFGQKDPLVRPSEVIASLKSHAKSPDSPQWAADYKLIFTATRQKHSYMGWQDGARHLEIALDRLDLVEIQQ